MKLFEWNILENCRENDNNEAVILFLHSGFHCPLKGFGFVWFHPSFHWRKFSAEPWTNENKNISVTLKCIKRRCEAALSCPCGCLGHSRARMNSDESTQCQSSLFNNFLWHLTRFASCLSGLHLPLKLHNETYHLSAWAFSLWRRPLWMTIISPGHAGVKLPFWRLRFTFEQPGPDTRRSLLIHNCRLLIAPTVRPYYIWWLKFTERKKTQERGGKTREL